MIEFLKRVNIGADLRIKAALPDWLGVLMPVELLTWNPRENGFPTFPFEISKDKLTLIKDKFPDLSPSNYFKGTPVMVNGILYAPNGVGLVEAFDAATGSTLWVQQPLEPTLKEAAGQPTRGVAWCGLWCLVLVGLAVRVS